MRVLFYDGKEPCQGYIVELYPALEQELLNSKMFELPHCSSPDGRRVIDLKIFCVKVEEAFNNCKSPVPKLNEIKRAITQFRYLIKAK